MFAKNCWYVAAFRDEISTAPLGRRIAGEPIVFFKQRDGTVAALEDRCCHRGLPLSLGEMSGDNLRCCYHGLEFDRSGTCVRIPGQETIPSSARVRSYPIEERGLAIWIWMGDPALADPEKIPPFPWFEDSSWAWKSKVFHIKCNHEMLNDNLLDLTHVAYIHRHTIGGNPETHFNADTRISRTAGGVRVVRSMPNSNPPPTYTKLVPFSGLVDRWQEFEFVPGLISLYTGAVDAGSGAYDGRRNGGFHLRIFDAITPETESTTLNLFCAGHNFRTDEPDVTNGLFNELEKTVVEDIEVLEAQQSRTKENEGRGFIDIKSDAAGIQARKVLAALRAMETQAAE